MGTEAENIPKLIFFFLWREIRVNMIHSSKSLKSILFQEEICNFFPSSSYSNKFTENFRRLLQRLVSTLKLETVFIYIQHLRNKVSTVNGIPGCSCNKVINSIIHGIIPHS